MKKSDLIEALAEKNNLSMKKSEEVINVVFACMSDALVSGDRVEIRGFGSFANRVYDAYTGRNPQTGAPIEVKAKKAPFFKVGKKLKEKVAKA